MTISNDNPVPKISPAIQRGREQIKILEDTVHKQDRVIQDLEKKISDLEQVKGQLEEENQELQEEIRRLQGKAPSWVKANLHPVGQTRRPHFRKHYRPGVEPNRRELPGPVTEIVKWPAKRCPHCRKKLRTTRWTSHYQLDLPERTTCDVVEHRVGWAWCSHCKQEVCSTEKLPRVKYGPRLHGEVSYLKCGLGLTLGKIQTLLMQQYALTLATSELSNILGQTASRFQGDYREIEADLKKQKHLNVDETSWRKCGNNHWLWSFSNHDWSYYKIAKSRGSNVIEDVLGKKFNGILASDFYSAYHKIESRKQKCWAHLLRETHALKKEHPKNNEIKTYSRRLKRLYERAVKLQQNYEQGANIEKRYKRLVNQTDIFMEEPWRHESLRRLSKRLRHHRNELYVFVKNAISGTNNDAEREIRPAVLMRKTSYGNRSNKGAETQAILMSLIRTCKKKGLNFIDTVTRQMPNQLGIT